MKQLLIAAAILLCLCACDKKGDDAFAQMAQLAAIENANTARQEFDTDGDGNIDGAIYYNFNSQGFLSTAKEDPNLDGVIDNIAHYYYSRVTNCDIKLCDTTECIMTDSLKAAGKTSMVFMVLAILMLTGAMAVVAMLLLGLGNNVRKTWGGAGGAGFCTMVAFAHFKVVSTNNENTFGLSAHDGPGYGLAVTAWLFAWDWGRGALRMVEMDQLVVGGRRRRRRRRLSCSVSEVERSKMQEQRARARAIERNSVCCVCVCVCVCAGVKPAVCAFSFLGFAQSRQLSRFDQCNWPALTFCGDVGDWFFWGRSLTLPSFFNYRIPDGTCVCVRVRVRAACLCRSLLLSTTSACIAGVGLCNGRDTNGCLCVSNSPLHVCVLWCPISSFSA